MDTLSSRFKGNNIEPTLSRQQRRQTWSCEKPKMDIFQSSEDLHKPLSLPTKKTMETTAHSLIHFQSDSRQTDFGSFKAFFVLRHSNHLLSCWRISFRTQLVALAASSCSRCHSISHIEHFLLFGAILKAKEAGKRGINEILASKLFIETFFSSSTTASKVFDNDLIDFSLHSPAILSHIGGQN